jgi:hypothetical protein
MQDFITGSLPISAGISRWLAAVAAIALLTITLPAEEAQASVRSRLTPEEFHRAGLDKLTKEELDFLDICLARVQAPPASRGPVPSVSAAEPPQENVLPGPRPPPVKSLPQGEAAFGAEEQLHAAVEVMQAVPSKIRSRVTGAFEGWSGHTRFCLDNGQVWQQAEHGVFSVNLTNPAIVIEKGLLGAFFLHLEGYGSRVKVKRLK